VRWRAVLGALGGLLLAVPLMLLLWSATHERFRPTAPEETRVSPVLSNEQRKRLLTYHTHCTKAADCESPLGCLPDVRIRSHYCADSECETDAQCPVGSVCRMLDTVQGGPRVRQCIAVGVRKEGEGCLEPPPDRRDACGPGLLCGGRLGWCGRPCRKAESTNCPDGFFCADVSPQPLCLPTCEGRECPQGQQCIRAASDGVSVCSVVYGTNCQQSPCPEGAECRASFESKRPGEVWMRCMSSCDPKDQVCPEGLVCHRNKCRQPCEPQASGACGTGYRCAQRKLDAPWLCEPDWEEE
jgi:hypothetical protein